MSISPNEMQDRAGSGCRALWYCGIGQAELRAEPAVAPGEGEVLVTTLWSGLSRGTERLVFQGQVPDEVADKMRAPAQVGNFPFPVKYGYAAIGRRADTGALVFALHPHQESFRATPDSLCALPDGLPARRAVLTANMETALNAMWDSGAGAGDRIAVVGAGVIGLLVAYLAGRLPGADVTAIDRDTSRAAIAERLGVRFRSPDDAQGEADIVFHASASQEGLASALALAGHEASVVELSWYGDRSVGVPLGLDFHARRLRLVSSQVGEVSASRRPRWSHRRRLAKALELLCDDRLDALITEEVAFDDLPSALPRLLAPDASGLFTAIRYAPAKEENARHVRR